MTRPEILDTAKKCVCGDREQDYGSPESNFQTIANLWIDYLVGKNQAVEIEPYDVAVMLALLKIARIASGHAKQDNWIDLAGYAACGGEIEGKSDNTKSDKPVEPWGDKDFRRMYMHCKTKCDECPLGMSIHQNGYRLSCCVFCDSYPAEARAIMDEMEGKKK